MGFSIRSISRIPNVDSTSLKWTRISLRGSDSYSTLQLNPPTRIFARKFQDSLRLMPTGTKLTTGNMIEFRRSGELVLGVVQGQREDKWIVHDELGAEEYVRGQDISLVLPGGNYTRDDLRAFQENASATDRSLVEISWQIMDVTNQPISLTKMTETILGDSSPVNIYNAYCLLKSDRRFFKQISRDPPLYFRMSPLEVQEAFQLQQKRQKKEQDLQNFKNSISEALELASEDRPGAESWLEGIHKDRISALRDYALGDGPSQESRNLAMESLRICELTQSPNGALRLLMSINVLQKHQPIALIRSGIHPEFPPSVQSAVQELLESSMEDPDASRRIDLTPLETISIDDAGTQEIDDALSFQEGPNGEMKVWVHVADPSRWIKLNSLIDLEARNRATSLYVPTGAIPVYPWELAEDTFSLKSGTRNCALSFGAIIGADGSIRDCEMIMSHVQPDYTYTYEEADQILEEKSNETIKQLFRIAELRNLRRKKNGAIEIRIPECSIKVDFKDDLEEPELSVSCRSATTNSHMMVQELMILAGEIAAKIGTPNSFKSQNFFIGSENGVALPYRSQLRSVLPSPDQLAKIPEGPCRSMALRLRMTRGTISASKPQPHHGLGLDSYVQITSPIRRYLDFLAHVQLKSFLRDETKTPLSANELEELVTTVNAQGRVRMNAAAEVENYWIAEYFRRNQERRSWDATFLLWNRQSQGHASVLIDEIGLERRMRVDRPKQLGEKLQVAVAAVDVISGAVRLEEVKNKGGRLAMDA
eukprot:g6333.t1